MATPLRLPRLMVGLAVLVVLSVPESVSCSARVGSELGACVSIAIVVVEIVLPRLPEASFQLPTLRLMAPVFMFAGGVSVAV